MVNELSTLLPLTRGLIILATVLPGANAPSRHWRRGLYSCGSTPYRPQHWRHDQSLVLWAINIEASSQRLLRGQDQINVESSFGLLWIDLCDQSTVSWRGDPHVYVWWPPRIAAWKVRGVLVAPSGARMLRCPVRVVIVTVRVSGPPFDHSPTQRATIPR